MSDYQWRIGDVFTCGESRWKVIKIDGDKAVLQSCSTEWAKTIPLTYPEWHEDHRWKLEAQP